MGLHSVTCHLAELIFLPLPQPKLVLDLVTPAEMQGIVDLVGLLYTEMVYPSGGFRGGAGGVAAPPLASFRKIHGLPISKTVRKADSTIIIITNFYLAASSHEIFLTVGGREGMKGLGAPQRHQLPHPPCKNPGSATGIPAQRRSPV